MLLGAVFSGIAKRLKCGVAGSLFPDLWLTLLGDTRNPHSLGDVPLPSSLSTAITYAIILCFAIVGEAYTATPAGTIISNQADASYVAGGVSSNITSNNDEFTVLGTNTANVTYTSSPANVFAGDTLRLDFSITNTGTNTNTDSKLVLIPPADTTVRNDSGYLVTTSNSRRIVSLPNIAEADTLDVTLFLDLPTDLSNGTVTIPVRYRANGILLSSFDIDVGIGARTQAKMELMFYEVGGSGPEFQVPVTQYDTGGGVFADIPPPEVPGGGSLVTDNPLSLRETEALSGGQTMYLKVTDRDHNIDSSAIDTIDVSVNISHKEDNVVTDIETLRLKETSVNSGIFLGYIATIRDGDTVTDGTLGSVINDQIKVTYQDDHDSTDVEKAIVLVDPFGIVFDTTTGNPLNGITITLINTDTGLPATVFGDDGVSGFPSTMVTGSVVTDDGGTDYYMVQGGFRFPLVSPGNYRLDVELPNGSGHIWPSALGNEQIQSLPGAPFSLGIGSRGEDFPVIAGPPINLDLPVDLLTTHLYLDKKSSKDTVAIGDFLQYRVTIENTSALNPLDTVLVTDVLPHGFRYENGSAKRDGEIIGDPSIAKDGRTIQFNLGDFAVSETAIITYVARVGATREQIAINSVSATADNGLATSNTATAKVKIREDFMRSHSILMGRVALNDDIPDDEDNNGIAGVRIFLEDGTYVVTDQRGMYHFEGIKPGTHVVQLDLDTLPAQYKLAEPGPDTHISEGDFAKFVDVQGGTLWRVDFDLSNKEAPKGKFSLSMSSNTNSAQTQLHYEIELNNSVLPVNNTRLMVALPDGTTYRQGSSMLNGKPMSDPKDPSSIVTYRLGDISADQRTILKFSVDVINGENSGSMLTSKVMAMIDTPTQKNARMQPVESILNLGKAKQQPAAQSTSGSIETQGVKPGQPVEDAKNTEQQPTSAPKYDMPWLQAQQAGFEWLFPKNGDLPAIPSVHVGIKHSTQEKVAVLLNNEPVPDLNFEYSRKNKDGTVAFSLWRGIDIIEGDNELEVIVRDKEGNIVKRERRIIHFSGPPTHVEFIPERSVLVADGRTPPAIAVRLTDKDGAPARMDNLGEYHVKPPYSAKSTTKFDVSQLAGAPAEKHTYKVGEDGIAILQLEPTPQSGDVSIVLPLINGEHEISATMQPHGRDWILVGLAEGTVGYNSISDNAEPLSGTEADDDLYTDDRIAFYAKGKVKGEWLLTIAYDNTKEKENSLHQTIDPGTYYTVYGDTSKQQYDAASREKLYVKIEKENFYALFGDYETELTKTKLSTYSRSLTGLKSRYRDDKYEVVVFASESNHAYVKDELQGKGITGPYTLSRDSIVMNSEKVVIETRDRFRSEIIISTQEMARHTDYDINYETGSISFRNPVYNRDKDLNPTFIIIKYESFDQSDRKLTYGGRAQMKVNEDLTVGVSHINEGRVGGKARLTGTDATYAIDENTLVHVEVAKTDSSDNTNNADGTAYLAEIDHKNDKIDVHAYIQEQDEEFGLGQTNGSEAGTRKIGADVAIHATEKIDIKTSIYRQYNLATDAIRDHIDAKATYNMENTSVYGGVKYVRDKMGDGSRNQSSLLTAGISHRMLENKLNLRLDQEFPIGEKESGDFPARTRIGADYLISKDTSIFGEHEWTFGDHRNTQTTSIGLKQRPWESAESFTTLSRELTDTSEKAKMTSGLRQTWNLNEQWSFDGGMERSMTFSNRTFTPFNTNVPPSSGSTDDFAAYSFGATYNPGTWIWNGRVEIRKADTEDRWGLATSAQTEPLSNLGLLATFQLEDSKSTSGSKNFRSDLRLGLAYRPPNTKWIILDKLDLIYDDTSGGDFNASNWSIINNLNANYRPNSKWQASIQYGAKYVQDTIDGKKYRGFTDLIGLETRYNLDSRWDVGARTSILHAWELKQFDYSAGLSVGHRFNRNTWVSVGYNFTGFRDDDFSGSDFTSKGVFVQFRVKFDQRTVKDGLEWLKN